MKKKEYLKPTIVCMSITQPMSYLMTGSVINVNAQEGNTDLGLTLDDPSENDNMWEDAF